MAAANTNRPGNMENVFENRNNTDMFGKIVSYDDKCKTLIIELSDGSTKSMTWSTFKGAWRKKAHTEMPVEETLEDQLKEEGFSEEEVEEITASVECGRTLDAAMQNVIEKREIEEIIDAEVELDVNMENLVPMPGIEKLEELKKEYTKPKKKRGAQLEYDGRFQNICAWAKEFGMSANTLYSWIYYKHMSVEEAFEKALSKKEATKND